MTNNVRNQYTPIEPIDVPAGTWLLVEVTDAHRRAIDQAVRSWAAARHTLPVPAPFRPAGYQVCVYNEFSAMPVKQ